MSSKVDTLLKQAAMFEKLSTGDRKAFLQALSQQLPRVIVPNEGSPGGHWVDPNPPKPAPAAPAPKAPSPSSGLPKLVVPSEGGGGQWLDPDQLQPTATPPSPDRDPNIMMPARMPGRAIPEREAPAKPAPHAPSYNPDTVNTLQIYLNKAFGPEIIAGQMGPIEENSKMDADTIGRLKMWGKKYNVGTTDVKQLMNMLLNK